MHCQRCGAALQETIVDGRARLSCPSCGYIQYVNPVPGVGVLVEHEGKLALIRRGHAPHKGDWALPAGFIEADESVEQAAVRETREETHLDVELIELFGVYSFPEGPPRSGLIIFYRARPTNPAALQAGDDAVDARFFAPHELPVIAFRTHREVLARWLQERHEPELAEATVGHPPPEVTVRAAEPRDHYRIVELMSHMPARTRMSDIARARAFARLRESGPGAIEVWVAESEEYRQASGWTAIIGFVAVAHLDGLNETRAWLDAMVVEPDYRRRGVGGALFDIATRRARERGASQLLLDITRASPSAQEFYRAIGFDGGDVSRIRLR
ncbi:MAG: GNAT family N-acetyltransferase [Thermoflexales bacterium]|nr:GNAT family N-acetyltransferase [Thermoflexales bacterium]